jgi:sugar lactone lactonase YvrE
LGGLVDNGDGFGIALERQNISISSGTLISQVDVDSDYSLSKSTSGVSQSYAYLTGDSEQNASENMTVDSYLMFLGAKNTIFGSSTGGLNRRSSTYSGEVVFEGEIVGIFFDQSRTRGQTVDGITYHNTSTYTYDFDESSPHTESNQYDTDKGRILEPGSFFGNDTSSTDSSGDWVSVGNYGSGTNNYLRFGADNNSVATGDYIRIIVKQATDSSDGSATVEEDGSISVSDGASASSPDPITVDSGSTLSSSSGSPRRMTFSDDGTKLFVLEISNDTITTHNLGTAYDISTQTSSVTGTTLASNPHASSGLAYGIEFSTDGTKMFTSDANTSYVYQWDLSTAWDVSTATLDTSDNLNTTSLFGVTAVSSIYNRDISFSEDGTELFILGADKTVHQISLGTAWDLSSYQTPDVEKDLSSILTGSYANSISFSPNGKKMFINEDDNTIHEFSIATAWDLSSTVTNEGSFELGTEIATSNLAEVTWNKDGTKFFVIDDATKDITEYSVSTPFSLANVDQTNAAESSSSVTSIRTGQTGGSGTSGTVGQALTGAYGTLTIQSTGAYTYLANHR